MVTHISLERRLDILRQTDCERKWYSLDDHRVCVVCNRVFTGRQIDILRNPRGGYTMSCPTEKCPSTFRHWFLCELPAAPVIVNPKSTIAPAMKAA